MCLMIIVLFGVLKASYGSFNLIGLASLFQEGLLKEAGDCQKDLYFIVTRGLLF